MSTRPRLLVSACLLGEAVRFDGGHRRSAFVASTLGAHVDIVPVCPEVESGLGTPRPSLRLVSDRSNRLRMVSSTGADQTEAIQHASARLLDSSGLDGLDGAILKKGSPSCGPARVKIYGENGMPLHAGRGLFAEALTGRVPHLAVEDEGRLQDDALRDSFLARIFTHARLRALFDGAFSIGRLVEFHTQHKFLLLAHSPRDYRELGRLVARASHMNRATLQRDYVAGVMRALSQPATPGRHANVLQHMAGFVRPHTDADSRNELHAAIAEYANGLQPIDAPRALLEHHVRKNGVAYLQQQAYLRPYPKYRPSPNSQHV
jgi:uncharacterized protein YbgA (DUF1722 family)/uncharacterized protein YbbK (DUF523 family)